jgi:hypothetical protein
MERYYKINVEETRATKIKANADQLVKNEGIEGYAMMWLHLTNNQKNNKQEILKIYNDYDNGIYVICNNDSVEAAEDYLKRLGLVIEYKEECVVVMPEEVFNDDDLDVELIEW